MPAAARRGAPAKARKAKPAGTPYAKSGPASAGRAKHRGKAQARDNGVVDVKLKETIDSQAALLKVLGMAPKPPTAAAVSAQRQRQAETKKAEFRALSRAFQHLPPPVPEAPAGATTDAAQTATAPKDALFDALDALHVA
ncbi:hypothetical protein CXG81DRAFT_26951 [Caulochytrium protostelioides]|uniref:Ribosome biogenesis protein SLX9 n=1 Tax=Caulochytrium protostelioides TaxID=1555241 RepID=A0A4P9X5J6_9FUNG|nr:hypothetical protein CXG81DRAFT_26951 [Caulochytrium protostelioides]|eukprot:RKP00331.1 hypothetical protein CXG81DRAFT_26951 [Caulochytrium protostelioides]